MPRQILTSDRIHNNIHSRIANYHQETVKDVQNAVAKNKLVVVGMKGNPFCRKVRKLLTDKQVEYTYLSYGSYLGEWRKRSALKMWTGWSTFPMVFSDGTLIGGHSELKTLLESGEL